jgi:NTP pyrophosphatase (non-canonical NTP hydrolase)
MAKKARKNERPNELQKHADKTRLTSNEFESGMHDTTFEDDANWQLKPVIERLLQFRSDRDWEKFHLPKELATALSIEAAELQELFLWKDRETAADISVHPKRIQRIREELADVIIYAVLMAHDLKIDLADSLMKKIDSNERRYPVEGHTGVARKSELT